MKKSLVATFLGVVIGLSSQAKADLKVGDTAPEFKLKTHAGEDFDLASRKGKWTVLYFYPKAETPGCTKQACAYRDNMKKVTDAGADVYGISADTVADQKAFHENHHLNFTLIADPDKTAINLYGTKMMVVGFSKRWTFVIDPELKIRAIEKDVDPVVDATKTAELITQLKKS